MRYLSLLLSILLLLIFYIKPLNSTEYLLNFVIIPICDVYFLTLNAATQKEAIVGCAQKAMVLANMSKIDTFKIFAPPMTPMWINSFAGLGWRREDGNKIAVQIYTNIGMNLTAGSIKKPPLLAFPVMRNENEKNLFICELPSLSSFQ